MPGEMSTDTERPVEWVEITCDESDNMHRARLTPSAGLTNFHPLNPEFSDPRLPPRTRRQRLVERLRNQRLTQEEPNA